MTNADITDMSNPDISDLRAADPHYVQYDLGTLIRFERILGAEQFRQVLTSLAGTEHAAVDVTMDQRKRIICDIFGYTEEQALSMPFELMEAEISHFFQQLLERSLRGRLSSMPGLPSNTKSAQTPSPSAKPSRPATTAPKSKAARRKPSSRKK